MATLFAMLEKRRARPIAADRFERVLAYASAALLVAVVVAIARGYGEWGRIPWMVWAHLLTIIVALVLTPPILLGRRGDHRHRLLGRIWLSCLLATALVSFGVRTSNNQFSLIHLISAWTVLQVPLIWWLARTHRVEAHRGAVRGLVLGALLVAGFFTFPFNRLLGHWLFG